MKTTLFARFVCHVTIVLMLAMLAVKPQSALSQPVDTLAAREARRDWMQVELTLDNSAYAATRAQIDKLIRQGEKPSTLKARYKLKGREQYDSQKIFRWAYSAYRQQKLNPQINGLIGIEEAMDRNLRPGAYDWVRLRFLVGSLQGFLKPTMELIEVGRRLLKVRYDDEEVMFHFIRNLKGSQSLADRKQAVSLARANASKYPRDVYWQWTLANTLTGVNSFTAYPTYAGNQAEIREYRKTLQMLPSVHPNRQRIIDTLVHLDMEFDAKGNRQRPTYEDYKEALRNTTLK